MGSDSAELGGSWIRAAGGVVLRDRDGTREVVVIHRSRHDDWSLPKGKVDPGESFEAAAVREVKEETDLDCTLVRELESARYHDSSGRRKLVRYWLMLPLRGRVESRAPDHEVDRVEWVALERAEELLTYRRDRMLVLSVAQLDLERIARQGRVADPARHDT